MEETAKVRQVFDDGGVGDDKGAALYCPVIVHLCLTSRGLFIPSDFATYWLGLVLSRCLLAWLVGWRHSWHELSILISLQREAIFHR